MSAFHRILVPVDFSPSSEAAILTAFEIADRFGASVALLHVCETPQFSGHPEGPLLLTEPEKHEEQAEAAEIELRLRRLLFDVGNREYPGVGILIRAGEASKKILDVAGEESSDLVVMGTHGRTGLAHLVIGSVAERVIRRAPCPVLIVKQAKVEPPEESGSTPSRGEP